MARISACLIVYHEEKNIGSCLESIKGRVDEIVVVHDGECMDKTLEIARKYTDKVFERDHAGFMEAHLPFAMNAASNAWILRIDADERLSDDLKEKIGSLAGSGEADAYQFIWPLRSGNNLSQGWPVKMALFDKTKISFLGVLHFLPRVNGRVKKTGLIINHEPENDTLGDIVRKKFIRRARLQAICYNKDFSTIEKFNYHEQDWPKTVRIRKSSPLLILPFDFLLALVRGIFSNGLFYDPLLKIREAFLQAFYKALVDFYLYKL